MKEKAPKPKAQKRSSRARIMRESTTDDPPKIKKSREQKERNWDDFKKFAIKKFQKQKANINCIKKVLCYQCYKNKKIAKIENKEDKIFQHIIHKHQDLFSVQFKQCREIMSSEDNDKINEHITMYKRNH